MRELAIFYLQSEQYPYNVCQIVDGKDTVKYGIKKLVSLMNFSNIEEAEEYLTAQRTVDRINDKLYG